MREEKAFLLCRQQAWGVQRLGSLVFDVLRNSFYHPSFPFALQEHVHIVLFLVWPPQSHEKWRLNKKKGKRVHVFEMCFLSLPVCKPGLIFSFMLFICSCLVVSFHRGISKLMPHAKAAGWILQTCVPCKFCNCKQGRKHWRNPCEFTSWNAQKCCLTIIECIACTWWKLCRL